MTATEPSGLPTARVRARFNELDPYGHVNHAVYLTYFEQARVDLLDSLGFGLPRLAELGYHIVVVEAHVRFRAPAVAGDDLEVITGVTELRRASSRWHQELLRDGEVLVTNDILAAITRPDGRPTAPPAEFLEVLRRIETRGAE